MTKQLGRILFLLAWAAFSLAFAPLMRAAPLSHGAAPLALEANFGQAAPSSQFLARGDGYVLFLKAGGGATLRLSPAGKAWLGDTLLGLTLAGARPDAAGVAQDELGGRVNYFIGNDPARWRRGIPTFGQVRFASVYPGVDLIYHGSGGRLEYDFAIAPGADAAAIALEFSGVDGVSLAANGGLDLELRAGSVGWQGPIASQEIGGQRVTVPCEYTLKGNTVRFRLGSYDRTRTLLIDPVLLYSTYLGGVSSSGDTAQAVTTDAAGNVYFTGAVNSFGTFPNTGGQFGKGGSDAFVTKLDTTGTNLIFSTFIGGTGNDSGQAIAFDGAGDVFIAGSASAGFPITNGFQTSAANGFLAKLSAGGSNVLYSTYIGDSVRAVGVDGNGDAVVAGTTSLALFPVTPGVLRTNPPSGVYPSGFVVKVNAALSGTNSLVYSTLFGGSGYDTIAALAVNAAGDAYLTGEATSTNFPVTPGAFQTNRLGYSDVYVAELNPKGTALVFSTLLGGSGNDGGGFTAGIALDPDGDVYVTGQTDSKDFPTTPGAVQPAFGGGGPYSNSGDAFAAKFNPAGTGLLWSTYLGGSLDDSGTGISVDSNRNVFVVGTTFSLNFPTRQPLSPPNMLDAFKLVSGATNWTGLAVGSQTINVIAVDPVNSSNVYAGATRTGTEPVIYKSSDAGQTWAGSEAGLPANNGYSVQQSIKALTIAPSAPNVIYASFGSGAGIYKSTDSGATWSAVTNGLPPLTSSSYTIPVPAVAVDPENPANVFAAVASFSGVTSGGVFRSTNGGLSWSNVLTGNFEALAFDPANSLNVYAANTSGGGFYKSTDGGNTWTNLSSGLPTSSPVQCIAINPTNPSVIYAGIGGYDGAGIYKSVNAGTNWSVTGQGFGSVPSVVFNAGNPNTLYAAYSDQGYGYGVVVSTNAGTNWTTMTGGMSAVYGNDYVNNLAADPVHPGTVYAASEEYVQEGFVAKLNASGSLLVYGTYLGGVAGTTSQRANNSANGVAVDGTGNVWVAGSTSASDFPVTTNGYQRSFYGNQSVFIAKIGSTASADVAVSLAASTNQPMADASFNYTIIVTNLGPANATAVTLEDPLPPSLTFQSAVLSQGSYQLAGQTLICHFGTVSNGGFATLTLTVTAALAGLVQNAVSTTANENDPALANNAASVATTVVQNSALHTDLALGVSVSPNPSLLGYTANYVMSVTNLGPDAASGVILTDALPASVTFLSANVSQGTVTQVGKNLTAIFGNLAAGASATLAVAVTPLARGSITNFAQVAGNESDPNPKNNFAATATPVMVANLQVVRSGPVPEQADQSFTLLVTNVGPDAVANTELTVTPPSQSALQNAQASQGSTVLTNGLVVASLGTIGVGAGATVQVTASGPTNVADYTMLVQASSGSVVLFTQTNRTVADLRVYGGTATPNPSAAGQIINFTAMVTNAGPDVAKNVDFQIGLDNTAMNLVSIKASTGTTRLFNYAAVLYIQDIIPALNPGATAQLTVQAQTYKAVDEGELLGADSDQPDPTPWDNSIYNIYNTATNVISTMVTNGAGVLSFAQANFTAAENSGAAYIEVIRQGGSLGTVDINYATTAGGSAQAGANYTPVTGTLTFAPGETVKTFTVPLRDDGTFLPNSTVSLGLSGLTGGYLGVPAKAMLTIFESDFPTNLIGNLQLISVATNPPLIFGNNPYPYGTPQVVALTPDGRHVLFNSLANNLANGVTNTVVGAYTVTQDQNVFVRDLNTNLVALVDVTPGGAAGDASAQGDALTPDGRFVVFESQASDLTSGDGNGYNQIFMRDLILGQTQLISAESGGVNSANESSYNGAISDNGRYVFFTSYATDLVPLPTIAFGDVYMRDTWSNVTTLVSVSTNGAAGSDGGSYLDGITPDGRYVVFDSYSSNLTPLPATNGWDNIFVRDTVMGTTTLASVDFAGTKSASGNCASPTITPDGKFVAFASGATNLTVDLIASGFQNIFLRNLAGGATVLVSAGAYGPTNEDYSYSPSVSSNGQLVAFASYAYNLSPLHTNAYQENIYVRDVLNGTNRLVSLANGGGRGAAGNSQNPRLTPDGRFLTFDSTANNLVTNPIIGTPNVYVADLVSNTMTLVSITTNGYGSTSASQERITPDGRYVAFESADDTVVFGAPYATGEVYRRDLTAAATVPASDTSSRTANKTSPQSSYSMSTDGRWITFDSNASDLTPNDTNGNDNIFLADTLNHTLTLASLNTNGLPANSQSIRPLVSANGNVIAFASLAWDLVTNPVHNLYNYNIYLRNLTNGAVSLASVNRAGGSDNGNSTLISLSADGRYILFSSSATNLTAVNINAFTTHLYVRDALGGMTVMVDVTTNGLPGDNNVGTGSLSPDGRFVAFTSASDWLVPGVSNLTGGFQFYQIYVRDLVAGTNTLVSATASGGPTASPLGVYYSQPAFGGNDRYVVFGADSHDLLAGDTNTFSQVYLRDLLAGQTRPVSVNLNGASGGNNSADYLNYPPAMTPDGRYVIFTSSAGDLVPNDTNGVDDVFVRDTLANTTTLVSVNDAGAGTANAASGSSVISSDGRYVAFQSLATDVTPGAFSTGVGNIYRRDLVNGVTLLISANLAGTGGGSGTSEHPAMSADSSVIAFDSAAYDLTPQDLNQANDLFIFGFVPVTNNADLALGMTSPAAAMVGTIFSYNLSVTNLGPANSSGVKVVDTLPPGVDFVSAIASQGTPVFGGGKVACSLGSLSPAAVATMTITVNPTVAGITYNGAAVSGQQPDFNPYNNNSQIAVTVSGSSAPVLTIGQLSGNQLHISWPAAASLELQTATNLAPPIVWQPLTSGIVTNGSVCSLVVTNPSAGANHFYRLATP